MAPLDFSKVFRQNFVARSAASRPEKKLTSLAKLVRSTCSKSISMAPSVSVLTRFDCNKLTIQGMVKDEYVKTLA